MKDFFKILRLILFLIAMVFIFGSIICEYSKNPDGNFFYFLFFLIGYLFLLVSAEIKAIIKYKEFGNFFTILSFPLNHTIIAIVVGGLRLFNPFHTLLSLSVFVLAWLLFLINALIVDFSVMKRKLKKRNPLGKSISIFLFVARVILVFSIVSLIIFLSYPGNIAAVFSNISWWLNNGATPVIEWDEINTDMEMLNIYIEGLEETATKIEERAELFQSDFAGLDPLKKNELLRIWSSYTDYAMNADYIQRRYYFNLNFNPKRSEDEYFKIRLLAYSGLLANFKNINRINSVIGGNYDVISILNEKNETFSIVENGYLRLKQGASSFFNLLAITSNEFGLNEIISTDPNECEFYEKPLLIYIRENCNVIKNNSPLIGDTFLEQLDKFVTRLWAPVQKMILQLVTGIEYGPRKEKLITSSAIDEMKNILKPGDLLLKRSNWQLTNVGIPGFWTHSGIYIGDLSDIDSYFAGETQFYGLPPSKYIKAHYPAIYKELSKSGKFIIEAVADGVVINPLENIARVDYFAALRPQLSAKDKFKALIRAFDFFGTPYDYDLNFLTDNRLVCSELIYKAYALPDVGLHFKLGENNGLPLLTPNDIVKEFDSEYGSENQELDLIIFRDASEWNRKSFRGSVEDFRLSWKRSKWDFLRD